MSHDIKVVFLLGACLFLVSNLASADYSNVGQLNFAREENVYQQSMETFLEVLLRALQDQENMQKMTSNQQQAEQMEQMDSLFFDSEEADEMADQLQAVTRYVGIGYDLLRGSPNGDFDRGGIDPGILSTRAIFDFTYDKGKEAFFMDKTVRVPDQVKFQPSDSCAKEFQSRAYSGAKSYQRALNFNVNAGVSLSAVSFGLSAAIKRAKEDTELRKMVNLDRREVCNLGRVEYSTDERGIHQISKAFHDRVQELPSDYSVPDYMSFIRDWGTHVIVRADVGTSLTNRSSLKYTEVYHRINKETGGGASLGVNVNGFGGSLGLDISVLEHSKRNTSRTNIRTKLISAGSRAVPLPISLVLRNISEALDPEYWTNSLQDGVTYRSLGIACKQENLVKALEDYPDFEGAKELTDPEVRIKFAWPDGAYALLQPATGHCPHGWSDGSRTQAVGKNTDFSSGITRRIKSEPRAETIKLYYCVKDDDSDMGFKWPRGTYCIARSGGFCPEGFDNFDPGSITWDDRVFFRSKRNKKWGALPDGKYEKSTTQIFYCCRSDGHVYTPILLPINQPFVLHRYSSKCQMVNGTQVTDDFIKFDSTSIHNLGRNRNKCEGKHPYDENCRGDHEVHFCYYQKK